MRNMTRLEDDLQRFVLCRLQGIGDEPLELIREIERCLGIKLYPSPPKTERFNPDYVRIYVKIPRDALMTEDEDLE